MSLRNKREARALKAEVVELKAVIAILKTLAEPEKSEQKKYDEMFSSSVKTGDSDEEVS